MSAFLAGAIGGAIGFVVAAALFSLRRDRVPLVDISRVMWLEITISDRGDRVWVNGPDGLLFRAYHVATLKILNPNRRGERT